MPSRVRQVENDVAWLEPRPGEPDVPISLLAVPDVQAGDYVLHHAGLALARLDPDEAQEILDALAEMDALLADDTEPDSPRADGSELDVLLADDPDLELARP